jgi:hypothetical protein
MIHEDHLSVMLNIRGTAYAAEMLADAPDGERVVRLEKLARAAEVYDVVRHPDGSYSCGCAHYTFRLAGSDQECKHIRSVRAAGLLDAYRPAFDFSALPALAPPDDATAAQFQWRSPVTRTR